MSDPAETIYTVILAYPGEAEGEWGDTWREDVTARNPVEAVAKARAKCWLDNHPDNPEVDDDHTWVDDLRIVLVQQGPDRSLRVYPPMKCDPPEEHRAGLERHEEIDRRMAGITRAEIARLRREEQGGGDEE